MNSKLRLRNGGQENVTDNTTKGQPIDSDRPEEIRVWYMSIDGDQEGPFAAAELKAFAKNGKLRQSDFIWKDGMEEWVPARRVTGLFTTPPPVPKKQPPPQPLLDQQQSPRRSDSSAFDPRSNHQYRQLARLPGHYDPNSFLTIWNWNLWLTVSSVACLFLGGLFAAFVPELGIILILLGMLVFLPASVFHFVLLYRCWSTIQGPQARTTPGKAVGFLFIPFFNFYWFYVAYMGLTQDTNQFLQSRDQDGPRMSENTALWFLISFFVGFVPYLNIIANILFFVFQVILMKQAADCARFVTVQRQREDQQTAAPHDASVSLS